MITITYSALSQKGSGHTVNEDSIIEPFEILDGLYITGVFDGITGNGGGNLASSCASQLIKKCASTIVNGASGNRDALIKLVLLANQEVLDLQKEHEGKMGATMTLCLIDTRTEALHVVHIGDCVLFKIVGKSITRLTAEDTDSEGRLTKWLGQPWPLDTETLYFKCGLDKGEQFILGSDGFIHHLSIQDYLPLLDGVTPDLIVRNMMSLAETSSKDDISIIYFDCQKEALDNDEPESTPEKEPKNCERKTVSASKNPNEKHNTSNSISWQISLLLVLASFLLGVVISRPRYACRCCRKYNPIVDTTFASHNNPDTINTNKYELEP